MNNAQSQSSLLKIFLPIGISLGLGAAFDYLFYGKIPGISFPIYVGLILLGLFIISYYYKAPLHKWTFFLIIPLVFFSLMVAMRASGFLTVLNIIICLFILLLLGDIAATGKMIKNYLIENYAKTILIPLRFIYYFRETVSKAIQLRGQLKEQKKMSQVVKGVLMALPLLFIFLLLFSSADLVFYKHLSSLIHIEPETLYRSVIIVFVTAVFIGAFGYVFRTDNNESQSSNMPAQISRVGIVETSVFLGLINLLFLTFIAVQLKYLFGGEKNIIALGFTYAEYARKGFFELIVVAVISFLVLWSTEKYIVKKDIGHTFQFKILSSFLIIQVLVIMISAFKRLLLYENAFGFTAQRFYSHSFIIWLGVIFILLLYKILINQKENIFSFLAFLSVLVFLACFNIINPDAFIARQNIKHFRGSGDLDAYYLSRLSEDAIPEVVKVFELSGDEKMKRNLARELYWKTQYSGGPLFTHWQSSNIARSRAKKVLLSKEKYLEENKDYGRETNPQARPANPGD